MNNRQLDELLHKATVPEPPASYWEEFPSEVTRIARTSPVREEEEVRWAGLPRVWAAGIGLAAACLMAAFVIGYKVGTRSSHATSVASMEKCLREVQAMFPNQVRAIVFENDGPHLLLSEKADVPSSAPIFLKVCDAKGCERIVTFSGQRVPIKGEMCDVLVDSKQNVLVVGQRAFWPGGMPPNTRVEATTL
jgi:hypothetical protein